MFKKNTNRQRGFTLIELLLVIALMAIAVGVTSDILVTLIRSFNKGQVLNEIEQSANFVSQKMGKELRNANEITALDPADPTPMQVGDVGTEITFLDSQGASINYSIASGVINRDAGTGATPLTSNAPPTGVSVSCIVSNECFKLLETNPQVIQIGIAMSQATGTGSVVFEGDVTIEDTIVIRDTY